MMPHNRLVRSESDRMIAGVCGGLADYLGIETILVRLAFVVLFLASGIGLAIYLILWVIMPDQASFEVYEPFGELDSYEDPASYKSKVQPVATVGVLLVLFGFFFLFNQMGWISSAFWPVVLIGAGIYFFIRQKR